MLNWEIKKILKDKSSIVAFILIIISILIIMDKLRILIKILYLILKKTLNYTTLM